MERPMADETMQTPETIPTPTPAMADESVLTSDLAASQPNHAPTPQPDPAPETPAPAAPAYGEFKLPDGATFDGPSLEQATTLFKEAGLPQEQAQKFIDLALSREQAAATRGVQAFVDLQTKWVSEIKADPEIGGTKFEASMASASRAIDRLGVPGLKEALNLAVGQYVITGGFLHVNIGRAPIASDTFEIPNGNNNQIYINALTNIALDRIAIRFSSADGVLISFAADTVTITNCDFANCNGGLIHATQGIAPATNLRIQSNYLHDQNCNQQNAVALHGATTATVLNN